MSSVAFGANIAFIEELYEKYRTEPTSVSASWQEFFADYDPQVDLEEEEELVEERVAAVAGGGAAGFSQPAVVTPGVAAPGGLKPAAPLPPPRPTPVPTPEGSKAVALRGAASKIVSNMETSLTVPTATSVRNIPVKVLEENRRVINNHLSLMGQSKASFTHVIAWAIVKAVKDQPRMNSAFAVQDGTPTR